MGLNKKIESAYNYLDYRILLNDDFLARTSSNHSYSLRAYSRDLDLSAGFVSDVLRGNKLLSPATGRDVFSKLGFLGDELDYAEKLVQYKSSEEKVAKIAAYEYIQQHYNRDTFTEDNERDLYIRTPEHLLVYGLIRREDKLERVLRFTQQLGIDPAQVLRIISDFEMHGYVREENGTISILKETIIRKHDDMIPVVQSISSRIFKAMQAQGGVQVPDRVCQSLILGLDSASLEIAGAAQKHFIQTLHRLTQQNTRPDHFLFYSDLFLVLTDVT